MAEKDDWKCAGCGKPSPGGEEVCDCPTQVVSNGAGKTRWKRPRAAVTNSTHCHDLIARLFETPKPILETKDIDLIRSALKHYADSLV